MVSASRLLLAGIAAVNPVSAAISLFNGKQSFIFPPGTSTACLSSFNTTLNCDPLVTYLYMQTEYVGWNATNLTALCTSGCRSSLTALKKTVVSSCADLSFTIGGSPMTADKIMDYYMYKFNLTCLSDGTNWCYFEQRKWFLDYLPKVTWPKFTSKWYPDWENDPVNGTNVLDQNGTVIPPYVTSPPPKPTWTNVKGMGYMDYTYKGPGPAQGTLNSTLGLEYDEYPLEIQCSSCYLQRFKLGFMSRFGETWNEVKSQSWNNMKKNCNLTETLYVDPSLDQSGPPREDRPALRWTGPPATNCQRNITSTRSMNATEFGLTYKVATGAFMDLNRGVNPNFVPNGTYCLPLPCDAAMVWVEGGVTALQLIAPDGLYPNISLVQMMRWNGASMSTPLFPGDTICIGPPGGAFHPADPPPGAAAPTVYTTTAHPALPTAPGTIPNCGLYYNTVLGDYCQMIAMNFSITFDQFRAMNPQVDSNCSNLWANTSYCVATVSGSPPLTTLPTSSATSKTSTTTTTKPPTTTTSSSKTSTSTTKPPTTSTSTSRTTTSSSTSRVSTVAAPAPTRGAGASTACQQWYVAQSGDYCYLIYTNYGITFDQFRAWNPAIDASCSNLQPQYAYCVKA